MKVMHVCETVLGGTGAHLNELIFFQKHHKDINKVVLVCPQEHLIQVPDVDHEMLLPYWRPSRLLGLPILVLSFIKSYLSFRPDIVHVHSTFAGVLIRVLAIFSGLPVIYCPHGWAMDREQPPALSKIIAVVERMLSFRTAKVIAVSEYEQRRALEAGIAPEKIVVIPNGIRTDVRCIQKVCWESPKLKVLFIGRLDRQKGIDIFLKSLDGLEHKVDAKVIGGQVVGGPDISREQMEHVSFLGWMDAPTVCSYIDACDVVVMPSRWEAFGIVALEAMRAAKAVIASSVGGLQDLVIDGITGRKIEVGDSSALHNILDSITRSDLEAMGREGRKMFLDKYSSDHMGNATVNLYHAVLSNKASAEKRGHS